LKTQWGSQSWLQPPFQAARRLKAGGGHNWPPHIACLTAAEMLAVALFPRNVYSFVFL
jgi:hypothetical protein